MVRGTVSGGPCGPWLSQLSHNIQCREVCRLINVNYSPFTLTPWLRRNSHCGHSPDTPETPMNLSSLSSQDQVHDPGSDRAGDRGDAAGS